MQGFARPRLAVAAVAASAASLGGLALGAPLAHATGGTTITVDPSGSVKTIAAGLAMAHSGDTVQVAFATYNENVKLPAGVHLVTTAGAKISGAGAGVDISGAANASLEGFTITGVQGAAVKSASGAPGAVIKGNTITNSGMASNASSVPIGSNGIAAVWLNNAGSVTFTGNHVDNNNFHGVLVTGTGGSTFTNNEFSYNADPYGNVDSNARYANGIDVKASGVTVLNNVFHNNQDSGLQFYPGGDNGVAVGNVSYNNGDHGIDNLNVAGGVIVNNTVFGNSTAGINVEGTSTNYTVENNISADNGGGGTGRSRGEIRVAQQATNAGAVKVDHNLVFSSFISSYLYDWDTISSSNPSGSNFTYGDPGAFHSGTGQGASDKLGNPGFVNAAGADFHIAAGSPAAGLGDHSAPKAPTADFDGNAWNGSSGAFNAGSTGPSGGGGGGGGNVNGPSVARVAGTDRYWTAIAVSQRGFPANGSAPAVVLATGDKFPDALSGVPLARAKGAPLLLTPSAGPDPRITAEIQRVLKPGSKVYVLGGTAAVPDTVVNALGLSASQIVHLRGTDRFGTSLAIANELGNPKNVVVARGDDGLNQSGFADALSAGPYAADVYQGGGAAVLLTNNTILDPAVKTYLQGANSIQAVGGPAAMAVNGLSNVQAPIKGLDRYDTAAQVAARFPTHYSTAGVAYGLKFPDALTGAALLANAKGPLLLTDSNTLPSYTRMQLSGVGQALGASGVIDVFGGTAVVSEAIRTAIATAANGHTV